MFILDMFLSKKQGDRKFLSNKTFKTTLVKSIGFTKTFISYRLGLDKNYLLSKKKINYIDFYWQQKKKKLINIIYEFQ